MAAYAALVSLMNTMEQIQNHPRHSISLNKKQIESLLEKVGFLQDFIEGYSHGGSKEAEVLESHIASAAYAAEDVIESHVVNQIHAGSISLLDLQKVIEVMDSIKEKAMKVKEERGCKDLRPTHSMPATSSKPLTTRKNAMVGFDDDLIQLMEGLTGKQSNRQIIPIVGMGGIGKTTLARNAYENLVIVQYFDIHIWVTVSQEYSVTKILSELLYCQRKLENSQNFVASTTEMDQKTEDQLGEQLYKSLSGWRYLIILDDMWSVKAWEKIKLFLPDNNNRSRIVVTTRLSNLAIHFGSSCLAMNFLDEDKSWNLFCEKAFAQEGCPPELEEVGKKIVKRCKGLPLSIVVIGGLLGKSYRTQECWENIAKDINSILNSGEDEHCLNILSLSYNHLPAHLKPCFLYMGIFPEDHEIRVSQLIKLWVAEGFLKPNKAQSLEEVAEGYLMDLVGRNLILVHRWGSNGKIKTCNIHDRLRDLCLSVAEREKFLCVMRVLDIPRCINQERRIVFHERIPEEISKEYQRQIFCALQSASLARSLIFEDFHAFEGSLISKSNQLSFKLRLLRVLSVFCGTSPQASFQQVNLRYLAYKFTWISNSELPSSISLLWNVQTLIIRRTSNRIAAPSEIWYMPQLRHVEIDDLCLPDPPSDRADQQDDFVLRNLQTLSRVVNLRWSEEVCKRIPNVKKLRIMYVDFLARSYHLYNLGRLDKLESLNFIFYGPLNRGDLLQNLTFPSSLQKLSLRNCRLRWEDLSMIGSLPHLEVLKLEHDSFTGPDDLIHWTADRSHFPVLENLVLYYFFKLDEIPSGIGEIPTLQVIDLRFCSESAAISAMKIVEEQESLGNEGLQVRVLFGNSAELESFKEKVELESFTSHNFQLKAYRE
ncbi:hypothetical protein Pfo_020740 [Paulownia fortunei]|nr:hypothetical protein Pfo_020740 [Paulownia fortunei]